MSKYSTIKSVIAIMLKQNQTQVELKKLQGLNYDFYEGSISALLKLNNEIMIGENTI